MDNRQSGKLLQGLRRLLEPHGIKTGDDAELLRQFADLGDEGAFAGLMQRHGRLVWAVCRNVLQHEHDAEDAFQGTFLVLARKAGSIRKKKSVASWLHGVAYRIAQKAKVSAARRHRHETQAAPSSPVAKPQSEMAWRELQAILDEELNRLPEKARAPFVLCCLEGKTKDEAARELGWKVGTVSSRLAHARKLLQQRLARRGVLMSALLCGTALCQETAASALPPAAGGAAVKAALAFAAGQGVRSAASAGAVKLAESVLRTLQVGRLKAGLAILLVLSMVGASAAWMLRRPVADDPEIRAMPGRAGRDHEKKNGPRALAALANARAVDARGKMTVGGQVVGRNGQPLAGAQVAVVAGEFRQGGGTGEAVSSGKKVLQLGNTDAQGRFHLSLERPTVGRHYGVSLIAAAQGHAPRWLPLAPRDDHADLRCDLEAGQVVRGRLVDIGGAPARGVKVHVVGLVKRGAGTEIMRFRSPPEGLQSWPAPGITDDTGQFLFRDAPPNGEIDMQVHDERFAPQWLVMKTGPKEHPVPQTFSLAPRRVVEGTVAFGDTGLPMPGAGLFLLSTGEGASRLGGNVEARADSQGRFRLNPFPGKSLTITAYPAKGKPYLAVEKSTTWPAGTSRHEVNISLPRGAMVRGAVVERASGQPVAGAMVEYEPRTRDNPNARSMKGAPVSAWWLQDTRTAKDGRFELPVMPGPGWLLIKGPAPEYIHVEISARQIEGAIAGGTPYFPDEVIPLDLKPATEHEIRATIRRGVTVTGKVLGQDGRPATSAFLMAPTYLPESSALRGNPLPMRLPVRDGNFELPGCDPEKNLTVWFFDPRTREGAIVEIAASRVGREPILARLTPCGSATARYVDSAGQPLTRPPALEILLRRGPDIQDSIENQVVAGFTVPVKRLCGSTGTALDARSGRVTFSCLIPGATYLVRADEGNGMVRKATIKVTTGQRLTLPDIVVKASGRGGR